MEGDLGKKSIHTSDSFLHSSYFGIMVNVLLLHADSDVTTVKYQILDGYSVIIVKSCLPTIIKCIRGFYVAPSSQLTFI